MRPIELGLVGVEDRALGAPDLHADDVLAEHPVADQLVELAQGRGGPGVQRVRELGLDHGLGEHVSDLGGVVDRLALGEASGRERSADGDGGEHDEDPDDELDHHPPGAQGWLRRAPPAPAVRPAPRQEERPGRSSAARRLPGGCPWGAAEDLERLGRLGGISRRTRGHPTPHCRRRRRHRGRPRPEPARAVVGPELSSPELLSARPRDLGPPRSDGPLSSPVVAASSGPVVRRAGAPWSSVPAPSAVGWGWRRVSPPGGPGRGRGHRSGWRSGRGGRPGSSSPTRRHPHGQVLGEGRVAPQAEHGRDEGGDDRHRVDLHALHGFLRGSVSQAVVGLGGPDQERATRP